VSNVKTIIYTIPGCNDIDINDTHVPVMLLRWLQTSFIGFYQITTYT